VFQDLGTSYPAIGAKVEGPVTPRLRDAAYSFRGESLASLVTLAGFLDKLELLD